MQWWSKKKNCAHSIPQGGMMASVGYFLLSMQDSEGKKGEL